MIKKLTLVVFIAWTTFLIVSGITPKEIEAQTTNLDKKIFNVKLISNETIQNNVVTKTNVEAAKTVQLNQDEVKRMEVQKVEEQTIANINKALGNALLKNRGAQFYKAAKEVNIDVYIPPAISIHETTTGNGVGTSDVLKECNNVAGINKVAGKAYKGWYIWFKNENNQYSDGIEESIYDLCYRLKTFYIDEGRTTIDKIGAKFAPLNDSRNGIAGMQNSSWVPHVTQLYNIMSNNK
jgi:hypothetical protein